MTRATTPSDSTRSPRHYGPRDAGAAAFGAYLRMLRENLHGPGRGKSLRRLARESGVAPSVLSRGERGLQDLRRTEYMERLAPHLGVRPSVMKRVAGAVTSEDVDSMKAAPAQGSTSRVLWARLSREIERLRGAPPETLEAVLAYLEFLSTRQREKSDRR